MHRFESDRRLLVDQIDILYGLHAPLDDRQRSRIERDRPSYSTMRGVCPWHPVLILAHIGLSPVLARAAWAPSTGRSIPSSTELSQSRFSPTMWPMQPRGAASSGKRRWPLH